HPVNKPYNESTPASELFADSGACMLTHEQAEDPLYVKGEQVRRELTEGENGVKMTVGIQVVDVRTCEPIANAAKTFWTFANGLQGVYGGGLNYPSNGNPNDLFLINTTALSGVQFIDNEGTTTFDTVVPGHYVGRTNHVHAIAHIGAAKQPNNTITGGRVAHIGQMYFDQKLLNAIEELPPYSINHQAVTRNAQDRLMMASSGAEDPVVRYALVGRALADEIHAGIRFGVDAGADHTLNPAAWINENGGH
ncbi:Intradiol ring-cleavage dioxygenase, partial [Colletotrichum navitas]